MTAAFSAAYRLLIIMILLATAAGLMLIVSSSSQINISFHALERHGNEAIQVMRCLERNGPVQIWQQPNGRIAKICKLDDGRYGVAIEDQAGNNITAFIKNKMQSLEQVMQYLRNRGGTIIHR